MTSLPTRPWYAAYPRDVPGDIDIPFDTMAKMLDAAFKARPSKRAYACRDEAVTFGQVDDQSRAVACFLQRLNLAPGTRVAIMLPTLLCYPIVLFGILRSGCTAVCINPQYTAGELRHVLDDCGAQVMFAMPQQAVLLETIRHATQVKKIVLAGPAAPQQAGPAPLSGDDFAPLADVLSGGAGLVMRDPALTAGSVALLQYTGGTTGVSRGAQLSHRNLVANVLQSQAWVLPELRKLGQDRQYTFACLLPLYHIFGLTACLLLGAHMGALTVLVANPFDVRGAVAQLAAHRVNLLPGVSTLFAAMMSDPRFGEVDFSELRVAIAGGMKLQAAVASRWEALTGCPIVEAYGLSETSPLVCCNPLDGRARPGTIGLPVPGTEVAILDADGAPQPAQEIGEIAVRGPQVMLGYWGNPGATGEVIDAQGFFLTGDVGTMDADGFVRILERKKDVVIVGGFNVYPSEIETVAGAHESVAECACIGVPDSSTGEAVKLFVVRKPGAALTATQVMAHCRASLTGYKLPKHIAFVEALPRTAVGKVSKPDLRALGASAAA